MNKKDALVSLLELIETHDNMDSVNFDQVLVTIAQDRAAYWTSAKYHSAITWGFVYAANVAGLEYAIQDLPAHRRNDIVDLFERLIPLNLEAKQEMATIAKLKN